MNKPDRKGHSKTIKNLEQNAKKGNLLSMFQLYENYSTGQKVEEKDEAKAQKYLQQLIENSGKVKFQLNSLNLHEFKRFRNLDIKFEKKVTVIIGDNGAGKTSIVEAIAKSLSWFNNNLKRSRVNGDKIHHNDINIKASDYAEIISEYELTEKTKTELSLATPIEGYSGNKQGFFIESKIIGDIYRLLAQKSSITLPLFAFYSVDRSNVELNRFPVENASNNKEKSRFEVLKYSLKASTKLEGFGMDYIELVNLAEGEKNSSPEKESLESIWNTVQKTEGLPEDVIKAIESAVKKSTPKKSSSQRNKYQQILKCVNQAIEDLVHEVKSLEVERSSGKPRILVENL